MCTTLVVWQTKCKLVTYIAHVLHVFTGPRAHAKTACVHMPVFEILYALNLQAHTCILMPQNFKPIKHAPATQQT